MFAPSLPPPLGRLVDLNDLSQAGLELTLTPDDADLAKLAAWAKLQAVRALHAEIALRRLAPNRFRLKAALGAEVEQLCVVTLEPVRSRIDCAFERDLIHAPGSRREAGALTLAAGDDETPDLIEDLRFDVWEPLLEEFSLALEPYPRKEGVHFEPPADGAAAAESPFAALAALRREG